MPTTPERNGGESSKLQALDSKEPHKRKSHTVSPASEGAKGQGTSPVQYLKSGLKCDVQEDSKVFSRGNSFLINLKIFKLNFPCTQHVRIFFNPMPYKH